MEQEERNQEDYKRGLKNKVVMARNHVFYGVRQIEWYKGKEMRSLDK